MTKTNITSGDWLINSSNILKIAGIVSARLDCLILLEDATKLDRANLLAHPEMILKTTTLKILDNNLEKRQKREPLAYIRGFTEFYGYKFKVNKKVLVPRPESEVFLELLANIIKTQKNQKLIDIGTGCGQLAVCSKLLFPFLDVFATDVSSGALIVAKTNSYNLKTKIIFIKSDLLENIDKYDYILANLPYVPKSCQVSPEVAYEPKKAVFASKNGLELINRLIIESPKHLNKNGYLLLESMVEQQPEINSTCALHNLRLVQKSGLVSLYQRSS